MENILKILIIEDEKNIAEAIKAYLIKDGYEVIIACNGEKGYRYFELFKPHLIILDLMIPIISGDEVCKKIRQTSRIPIIILSAKTTDDNIITGFDIGADDYITKPFSPRELMARIKSVLRRSEDSKQPLYNEMSWNNHELDINFNDCTVRKNNNLVSLTSSEFKILSLLAKYPDRVFTRENIIYLAFDDNFDGYDRTIDSHIKNLRAKIENDSNNPVYIITIRGIGYRFLKEKKGNETKE